MPVQFRFPLPTLGLSLAAVLMAHGVSSAKDREERDDHEGRGSFQIGLWGDLPYAKIGYGGIDGAKMQALIKDMNSFRLDFSIFDGDTKDGSSLCTDANVGSEPARLFGMFKAPLSDSFQAAKAHGSRGIMIVIQADPGFDWP